MHTHFLSLFRRGQTVSLLGVTVMAMVLFTGCVTSKQYEALQSQLDEPNMKTLGASCPAGCRDQQPGIGESVGKAEDGK